MARRRDRQRVEKLRASSTKAKARQRQVDSVRQLAIQGFVDKHSIECFGCGTVAARWAKNGINKRGAWVICVPCVARHRREKGLPEKASGYVRLLGYGRGAPGTSSFRAPPRKSGERLQIGADVAPCYRSLR